MHRYNNIRGVVWATLAVVWAFAMPCNALCQQLYSAETLDSLRKGLPTASVQQQFDTWFALGFNYGAEQPDSALVFANKALANAQQLGGEALANASYIKARAMRYQRNYADALLLLLQAIDDAKRNSYKEAHSPAMVNLLREVGNIYLVTNHPQLAKPYLLKADGLLRQNGTSLERLYILECLGYLYLGTANDSAELMFRQMAELTEEGDQTLHRKRSRGGLGRSLLELGKVSESIPLLRENIKHVAKHGPENELATLLADLGKAYTLQGQLGKADSLLGRAIAIQMESGDLEQLAVSMRNMSALKKIQGNLAEALEYLESSAAIKDTLVPDPNFGQLAMVEQNFNQAQRAAAQQARQEAELEQELVLLGATMGCLLMLVVVFFTARSNRNKRKANRLLNAHNQDIAEKAETLEHQREELVSQANNLEGQKLEIARQREELSRLNSLKDRMISIISHDFRAPLNALSGAVAVLQLNNLSPSQREKMFKDIGKRIGYGLNLIENLLHWTRSQMEGNELYASDFPLKELADEVVLLLGGVAEEKGISLQNHIPQAVVVHADRDMINFVIRNMVSNGIKFTLKGGQVHIEALPLGHTVRITVSDTGVGMSKKRIGQLMGHGIKESTRGTANEKGTGLGLKLCQEFIAAHGGTLHVNSVEEEGTSFWFELPKSQAREARNQPNDHPSPYDNLKKVS